MPAVKSGKNLRAAQYQVAIMSLQLKLASCTLKLLELVCMRSVNPSTGMPDWKGKNGSNFLISTAGYGKSSFIWATHNTHCY